LLLAINSLVLEVQVPVTALVIYFNLALLYVGGSRLLARSLMQFRRAGADRVIIYGAGAAGAQVLSALRGSGSYYPVAFVDDSRSLQGSLVNGIEVFAPSSLPALIRQEDVNTVLLALPSLSRRRRKEILQSLETLSIHVQTVPDIFDIVTGRANVEAFRDVDANDLLGRDPVPLTEHLIDACIRGKNVMVTGAGGSIGSQLCRQIMRQGPKRLVLFEMSEIALYGIERDLRAEMARDGLEFELLALLGNAHHKSRVREVMQACAIQTVYHAAAYKHLPIVEQNVIEGVHNNVFSTLHAAEAALLTGVETFVLISTDKAVNPTSVMGATKRMAEIVLQALQTQTKRTRFCMVRFGNVLGSSGSVVPLFQEQIRSGGPVTVTHPEVRRFFMTIPEAAALVLEAGSMGKGGDVFVLDMGQPVKIDELARRMINLMGYSVRDEAHPDGDIEIAYTGLRQSEKLYEELSIGNNFTGTEHPMVMRAIEHSPTWDEVSALLSEMTVALDKGDCGSAIAILERAVSEYKKPNAIHDLVWSRREAAAIPEGAKVAVLAEHRSQKMPPAAS
jgi:FlaA1/EpsC-like NDP-sugar epimerase